MASPYGASIASGTAQGAATGAAVGGPWGALIGAAVGAGVGIAQGGALRSAQRKRRKLRNFRAAEELRQSREFVELNTREGNRLAGAQRAASAGAGFDTTGTSAALENDTLFQTVLENERVLSGAAFTRGDAAAQRKISRADEYASSIAAYFGIAQGAAKTVGTAVSA